MFDYHGTGVATARTVSAWQQQGRYRRGDSKEAHAEKGSRFGRAGISVARYKRVLYPLLLRILGYSFLQMWSRHEREFTRASKCKHLTNLAPELS